MSICIKFNFLYNILFKDVQKYWGLKNSTIVSKYLKIEFWKPIKFVKKYFHYNFNLTGQEAQKGEVTSF